MEQFYVIPNDATTFALFCIITFCIAAMAVARFVEMFWNITHNRQSDIFLRLRLDAIEVLLDEMKQSQERIMREMLKNYK